MAESQIKKEWRKKHLRRYALTVSDNQYPELIEYIDNHVENISEWLKLASLNQMESELKADDKGMK